MIKIDGVWMEFQDWLAKALDFPDEGWDNEEPVFIDEELEEHV